MSVALDEPMPADYAWNARAFALDMGIFNTGMAFISSTTVIPTFVATLTDSEFMVGLASGVITGGWLLPQLIVASLVSRLPQKKPIIMRTAWLGRPLPLVIGLLIWLLGLNHPMLSVAVVLVGIFLFFVSDAVVSVPWFDLMAKTIPANRRGRVQGTAQVVGALGGFGVGFIVRHLLSEKSPLAFPNNYAVLFGCAALGFFASAIALSLIREPEAIVDVGARKVPSLKEVFSMMPRIMLEDRAYLRLVIVRIVSGFATMGSAFYVLHATRGLGLGQEVVGLFVSTQVVGTLLSGLLMGIVQDRWGPLVHIRLVIALSATSPLLALLLGALHPLLGNNILYPYLMVYVLLGISMGSMGFPYFNWIMEHVESSWRPLYIGLINTLSAILMLAPALAGWVAGSVSYPAVFWLCILFAGIGLALTLGLPCTRQNGDTVPAMVG